MIVMFFLATMHVGKLLERLKKMRLMLLSKPLTYTVSCEAMCGSVKRLGVRPPILASYQDGTTFSRIRCMLHRASLEMPSLSVVQPPLTLLDLTRCAQVYRCWIVWEKNYYIIALPLVLLISNTGTWRARYNQYAALTWGPLVCGIYVCWLFSKIANASIFAARLTHFISTFFGIGLAQNIITTSLIAFCIWRRDKAVSILNAGGRSSLMPVVHILVESAAIYVAAMLILVILYALNQNTQYIVLETITPTVVCIYVFTQGAF